MATAATPTTMDLVSLREDTAEFLSIEVTDLRMTTRAGRTTRASPKLADRSLSRRWP